MNSVGFGAIAATNARVLILGTLPGVRSLEQAEYYAHPRNSFWWIMGELAGASPALSYKDRLRQLKKSRIALWDVCRAAERAGSSDANIVLETVEPNDFSGFLSAHTKIEQICFNGREAENLFRRLVLPLPASLDSIPRQTLPSTSPAHAGMQREEKLQRWRKALEPFIDTKFT
jgi:hypoxanthine-DNA glycosylase